MYARYIDDGRSFLYPIRKGWRWVEGGMQYSKKWQCEDEDMSPVEVKPSVLKDSLNGVEDYF